MEFRFCSRYNDKYYFTLQKQHGMKIKIGLVDDHQLFLSGVRAELGDTVNVVGSASVHVSAASDHASARSYARAACTRSAGSRDSAAASRSNLAARRWS